MRIRDRLHTDPFRSLLGQASDSDSQVENLLNALVMDEGPTGDFTLHAGFRPKLFCTCSREKFEDSICLLGEDDRKDILEKQEPIVIRCEFCQKTFTLTPDECAALWAKD